MSDLEEEVKKFVENNDLKILKSEFFALVIRDSKANPELYQKTKIEENFLELHRLLDRIDK